MSQQRRSLQINSMLTVLLIVALTAAVNYLSRQDHVRLDLTEDHDFTLSDGAKSIVRSLDAPITIEVFLSRDLPDKFAAHTQAITDKLAEFQAVARVPFEVHYTDPGVDEEESERARRLGAVPRQTSARSRGKLEAQVTWLGLSIHYQDTSQALPFIESVATLEHDIAQALRHLQSGATEPVIGFVVGFGETDLAALLATEERHALKPMAQVLDDNYELRAVDLATAREVPAGIDVLIEMGGRVPLSESAMFAIDQYVMRGGAFGLFPYAALPELSTLRVHPAPADYTPLVRPWGLKLRSDLVIDRQLNGVLRLPAPGHRRGKPVNSPLVPMLRNLNQDHPITRRMDTVVAPFTGSIEMAGTDGLAGVEATLLAATSREATVGATVTSLDPLEQAERQPSEQPGPHAVLVALSGALPSGWAGRSAPDGTGLPPLEVAPEGTRLLVGMSFEMPLANPGLLLAGVDWMAADEDLLSIRPRLSAPPLLVRPDNVRWVRAANVIGVPLLVSVFGFLRLRGRRRRGAAR